MQTFTPNDLMLYVFNECSEEQALLIQKAMATNVEMKNEVESLQAPNKRAKIEKRANSLKYFIILNLIQFVNRKKEVKKIHRVV